jgi:hypothetical protein
VSLSIPEGAGEAYERLRQHAVQLDSGGGDLEGRRVFMRCGFAAWAQIRPAIVPSRPPESHVPSGGEVPSLDAFGTELVRLVAGLILTRQEVFAACLN